MSGEAARCLSADEMVVLKFAVHRQLTRWANKRELTPSQQAQRVALLRAARVLEDRAFVRGCELQPPLTKENADAQ